MRVLHFYKTYLSETVGGIEQVIFQLCESSGSWGIDNHVLTLSSDPHPPVVPFGGHVVHRARLDLQLASTGFSLSVFKQFRELAAEADVVNYHFPWPFMDLVHFLTGMNKPSVVTYHSDIIRQRVLLKLYRPLMSRFLHSVDRIVAASPNYFSTSDVLRQYREKTRVITYGLDKDGYPKPAAQRLEHWREKLGPRFFLFVGVMRYYKGLHILLDALQGTDYPVVIVGAGPLQAELYAQAAALGLRNVHFLGRVDDEDKVALLQLSYAMVFPSHLRSCSAVAVLARIWKINDAVEMAPEDAQPIEYQRKLTRRGLGFTQARSSQTGGIASASQHPKYLQALAGRTSEYPTRRRLAQVARLSCAPNRHGTPGSSLRTYHPVLAEGH